MKKQISGEELIKQTFFKIKTSLRGRLIFLGAEPWAEIASDFDREGHMRYRRAALVRVSGNAFLIAMGEKSGSYLAEKYGCDITAIRLGKKPVRTTKKFLADAVKMLERSEYFENSLVMTMSWGDIATGVKSCFGYAVKRKLSGIIDSMKASNAEFDNEYLLLSTLLPPTTLSAKYYPKSPEILAKMLIEVLQESCH